MRLSIIRCNKLCTVKTYPVDQGGGERRVKPDGNSFSQFERWIGFVFINYTPQFPPRFETLNLHGKDSLLISFPFPKACDDGERLRQTLRINYFQSLCSVAVPSFTGWGEKSYNLYYQLLRGYFSSFTRYFSRFCIFDRSYIAVLISKSQM